MTTLPLEPFFSGPGLDRADALRSDAEAIGALAKAAGALQLRWSDGLPVLGPDGKLTWAAPDRPELFLGFAGDSPRFSSIEDVMSDARSAFPLMALLDPVDAPLFAAALSLPVGTGATAFVRTVDNQRMWFAAAGRAGAPNALPNISPASIRW